MKHPKAKTFTLPTMPANTPEDNSPLISPANEQKHVI
jgi:hypothetical protein